MGVTTVRSLTVAARSAAHATNWFLRGACMAPVDILQGMWHTPVDTLQGGAREADTGSCGSGCGVRGRGGPHGTVVGQLLRGAHLSRAETDGEHDYGHGGPQRGAADAEVRRAGGRRPGHVESRAHSNGRAA